MTQLHGLKTNAVSIVTFLSISTIAMGNAAAQEAQKPPAQVEQKTEQTNSCGCCKKMMKEMKDGTNTMPGMNHSTSPSK